jgi:hypothetical protein
VTRLRTMMLEELQRRNYSQNTVRAYIRVIRELTAYFRKPPDRLGPEHMRLFQNHHFSNHAHDFVALFNLRRTISALGTGTG